MNLCRLIFNIAGAIYYAILIALEYMATYLRWTNQ